MTFADRFLLEDLWPHGLHDGLGLNRSGCRLFTFRGEKVSDLWVLGDLKGLEDQLKPNSS